MSGNEQDPYIIEIFGGLLATDRESVIGALRSYLSFRVSRSERRATDAIPESRVWMALTVARALSLTELQPDVEGLLEDVRQGKTLLPIYEKSVERYLQGLRVH